ncbi:MAG: DNA-processing protein DprA [Actinomycetales bacterium]
MTRARGTAPDLAATALEHPSSVSLPGPTVDERPTLTIAQRGWVNDELVARVVWSRLADSNDRVAGKLRQALGARESLAVALAMAEPPEQVRADLGADLLAGSRRWALRLPMCDPRRDLKAIENAGGRVLIPQDPQWPAGLSDLGAAEPVCLWSIGTVDPADLLADSVALVGSRAATGYGVAAATDLAAGISRSGVRVVSGAAFGVDAAAHRGAIAVDAPTVAVLACGAGQVYPAAHGPLLARIAEDGLIISESPPGSSPTRWRFLERNRLIAAMTRATVVVEAAWRSGALNTANHAQAIGRPCAAVPGPVTSAASAGCHRLIRDGACLVTESDEVLELIRPIGALFPAAPPVRAQPHDGLDEAQLKVWDALPPKGWRTEAQLCVAVGLPHPELSRILGQLQAIGRVVCGLPGQHRWKRADGAG